MCRIVSRRRIVAWPLATHHSSLVGCEHRWNILTLILDATWSDTTVTISRMTPGLLVYKHPTYLSHARLPIAYPIAHHIASDLWPVLMSTTVGAVRHQNQWEQVHQKNGNNTSRWSVMKGWMIRGCYCSRSSSCWFRGVQFSLFPTQSISIHRRNSYLTKYQYS